MFMFALHCSAVIYVPSLYTRNACICDRVVLMFKFFMCFFVLCLYAELVILYQVFSVLPFYLRLFSRTFVAIPPYIYIVYKNVPVLVGL